MFKRRLARPVTLAWSAVVTGSLLAAAALLQEGWRGSRLPAGTAAVVGTQPIPRETWLRALQSVQGDGGRQLDETDRRRVLQRLIDEELLFQHALASGLVRDDPGLRKTVVAALVEAATASEEVDERVARALFAREPQRFATQPRLRVAALHLPAGMALPPQAVLVAALQGGPVPAPMQGVLQADLALSPAQLAQRLGGSAATAVREANPGQRLGPLPSGSGQLYLMLHAREQAPVRYEDVAAAVRAEVARRQADAALEALLVQLRRDNPIRVADDAQP